jgi:hypothetical protein
MQLLSKRLVCVAALTISSWGYAAASDSPPGQSKTMPSMREAQTQAELKPSIGLSAGITDTNDNRRNAPSWAVEAGFQPYIPFGVALEVGGYVSDHKDNTPSLTRTKLLVKGNYNFGGDTPVIKDSYVGLGIGPVWDNVAHRIDTELGIAPQIGFDIPLGQAPSNFTLGANANYMFVGGAKPDVFALNGIAKYWF